MKYLLVDTANLFFRARHGAHRGADTWEKIGMALHITLMAANKMARRFDADHVVFTLEGRSWRKDAYKPYKNNRTVARAALTEHEQEEDKMFWETYDNLTKYLSEKTNCSVIRCATAEGDDIIARWIALHPQDEHIIVSSDTDFVQLVAQNVKQYNGITDELITVEGIFDAKGKRVIDKKTKEEKTLPNPEWLLFEKCVRGDSSDNVFSAYPGVRTKGTKNKVGLLEAFEDKNKKGFNWNNLMLQRWTDPDGIEHRVLDDYERNRMLIDLTAQPQEVKDTVDACIREMISHKDVGQVGVRFMQFCGKFELNKCSENAESFGKWMNETYKGVLNESNS
jgi:5'-3' exonuclease